MILILLALLLAPAAQADPGEGSWHPDGMVCRIGMNPTCRYVAPGCDLVRVMDDQGPGLSGTRWALFCRAPRGAS